MSPKQQFIIILILILITRFTTSCYKKTDDIQPYILIENVIVNHEGKFILRDSMLYLVNDTAQYEVGFETNPAGANIYYSKNENDFFQPTEEWITVDSTFKSIRFYAAGCGYNETAIHEIYFGFGNDSIISTVQVYPNPFTDTLNYRFERRNLRGKYGYSVLNLQGEVIRHHNDLVTEDETESSINLNRLSPGIYLLRFDFGNTKWMNRIVKK